MLRQMRNLFSYLKWILMIIVIMFLWWVFVPGGSAPPASRNSGWAANVNGEAISIASFQNAARQLDARYRNLLGDQYDQRRGVIRIGIPTINALIDEELVHQEALSQGIRVTDRELAEMIRSHPAFQENGRFIGNEAYQARLSRGQPNRSQFEEGLRRELVIQKFRGLVQDGVEVRDEEVEQEFLQRNERLIVDYLIADRAALAGGTDPGEIEVARYYSEHPEQYSRGEGRTGLYVLFTARELAESQEVTEIEVRNVYDRDRDTRYTRPEQRLASHILFRLDGGATTEQIEETERKARDVLQEARSGGEFSDLARDHSDDVTSAAVGGSLGWFGHGSMVKEFEEAAFALEIGGVSDLVRTSFGFHIIKLFDSREGKTESYAEVHDQLLQEIRLNKARSEVLKRSTEFAAAASGGRLEEAARARDLNVSETGTVRLGDALPGVAASQSVTARMMSLDVGEVSESIPAPAGQVIVQVTGIAPPEPQPLEQIRARVVSDLQNEKALERVKEALEAVREKGDITALGRHLGTEVKTEEDLARGAVPPGVPSNPEITRQLRNLPAGTLGSPVATPQGFVVLSVRERRQNREEMESQRDSIENNLTSQKRDRLYRALLLRLRERSRIEINEPIITQVDQG